MGNGLLSVSWKCWVNADSSQIIVVSILLYSEIVRDAIVNIEAVMKVRFW